MTAGPDGYPKWHSVDLNYPLRGWERHDCAAKYRFQRKRAPEAASAKINPILEVPKEIMGQ